MNDQQLADTLARVGFKGKNLKTAFGIAKRESGGRPEAFNPDVSTGDQSYGLFQINMLGNLGPARRSQFGLQANEDLLDPETNAKVAYRMSSGGKDFGAWGIGKNAYRSGAGEETIAKYTSRVPRPRVSSGAKTPARSVSRETPPAPGPTRYRFTGGINAMQLAQGLLSGMDAGRALEEATTPMERHEIVQKIPRLPKVVAEGKARKYGGTTDDFGDVQAPNEKIGAAIQIAKQQIGKPYVWAASSPGVGFDCSGLIEYAFEAAGIKTPGRLTTGPMAKMGQKVPWKQVQPGDWIVRDSGGSGHVVMYVGNGQVIAAPQTGEVVQYQPLSRFASDSRYGVRRWHGS